MENHEIVIVEELISKLKKQDLDICNDAVGVIKYLLEETQRIEEKFIDYIAFENETERCIPRKRAHELAKNTVERRLNV